MSLLSHYLFKQTLGPLILFTIVLSLIVWLTQSLQWLDLIINRGQSAGTFLLLTLYVLPSLLTIIIPFAFFCAALYTLYKLCGDRELMVMWSAGVSQWAIARPFLLIAVGVMMTTLLLNLYLMPAGYRALKDKVYEIRADIATTLVRDRTFTNPSAGLTVYTGETRPNGELRNLLVHDNREPERTRTYIAEVGRFVRTPDGPQLIMINGNIQQLDPDRKVTMLAFDRYVYPLAEFEQPQSGILRELSERYLHELLRPDLAQEWDRKNRSRLLAEGHNRLASPLYALAFAMIALCAVMLGNFNRRGFGKRIALAFCVGLIVRILGFALQTFVADSPGLVAFQYLIPLAAALVCVVLLDGPNVQKLKSWRARLFGPPPAESAV